MIRYLAIPLFFIIFLLLAVTTILFFKLEKSNDLLFIFLEQCEKLYKDE